MDFHGIELDEIDDVARQLMDVLDELDANPKLAVYALSRAIADIGTPEDLDMACRVIDEFSDMPRTYEFFEEDEDEDEW